MGQTDQKKFGAMTVVIFLALVLILGITFGKSAARKSDQAEIQGLKRELAGELKIRSIEPVVWVLSNYPGSDVAKDICSKGGHKTRQGTAVIRCADPDGTIFTGVGYNNDQVPVVDVVAPFGKVGLLADFEKNPNAPNFANYILRHDKE